ncbi:DUF63 family protein [Halomarina oriensis]|uniref:DUF63 family protein n=1 Tax=Halomarina oriensis TaxID=671145 RepID=A0A6B0GPH5_9EURY|nr:DUF63 family protein [Halomarina oriensis]MWG36732.1 DUF63 family protein [Halomarina oriensis]
MSIEDRATGLTPARAWLAAFAAALAALVGGSLVLRNLVYDRFVWQYFWGPVYADAHNAACAVKQGGETRLLGSDACASVAADAVVARPGYTVVSEIGYAVTLIFMLAGVLFLLRGLELGEDRTFFFALVPFMFFGGALRVVEDANNVAAATEGVEQAITYPLNALIISPVIYFVVFAITLATLVVAVFLDRRGVVDSYAPLVFGAGTVYLLATVGYIYALVTSGLASRTDAGFYPQVTVAVVLLSLLIAVAVFGALRRYEPGVVAGVGLIGFVVLFGHALDGVANVLAADWWQVLGLPFQYYPKHPVNSFIIDVTDRVLPPNVSDTIGDAWPFLLVKILAATAVIWLFDEEIFEESPRYAILLLVAILAVGLGPGTRDMLRATFAI